MQYKQRGNDDQAGALWVGEQEEDLCVCWDVADERKWAELGKGIIMPVLTTSAYRSSSSSSFSPTATCAVHRVHLFHLFIR